MGAQRRNIIDSNIQSSLNTLTSALWRVLVPQTLAEDLLGARYLSGTVEKGAQARLCEVFHSTWTAVWNDRPVLLIWPAAASPALGCFSSSLV